MIGTANLFRVLRLTERYSKKIINTSCVRCISHHPMKFLEVQDRWREKDNVEKRWKLIYKAPMDNILKFVTTYLSFTTGAIGIGGLYYSIFVFELSDMNNPVILGDDVVIANSPTEYLIYLGSFVAFHSAVKILLSKYVLRIYQDGDEYLAIFRGHTYNSINKHKFHLDDFKKLNPTFVLAWGNGRFGLGDKHAILLENYFKTPQHLNYLLYKEKKEKFEDDED